MLLAAARDAYLSGRPHREIVALLTWTLNVIAHAVPDDTHEAQRDAIAALEFAERLP